MSTTDPRRRTAADDTTAPAPGAGSDGRDGRTPVSLQVLGGVGVLAIAAMAFAPQVGMLDPRTGYDDEIIPGTDGTAHYESPETTRRVDVQLMSLGPPTALPPRVTVPAGRRVLEVRLRLTAARPADITGCRVELYRGERRIDAEYAPGSPRCGEGSRNVGSDQLRSTAYLLVPTDARPTQVRVMWDPPAFVGLPAV